MVLNSGHNWIDNTYFPVLNNVFGINMYVKNVT